MYPHINAGEWFPKEAILDYDLGRYRGADPDGVLDWNDILSIEENRALRLFKQSCDSYRKFISAAMYSKRFGKNHPFNLILKEYLIEQFPYHSASFKNLLQMNFEEHHRETKQSYILKIIDSFNRISLEDYEENCVYLEKDNEKLLYTLISSGKEINSGQLDIHIKKKLNLIRLRKNKNKILEKLSEQGHELEPKKGLSEQEWKNNTYKYLIQYSEDPTYMEARHYVRLTYLLKELDINISITKSLFEINT